VGERAEFPALTPEFWNCFALLCWLAFWMGLGFFFLIIIDNEKWINLLCSWESDVEKCNNIIIRVTILSGVILMS
jgi:hypothetical protein